MQPNSWNYMLCREPGTWHGNGIFGLYLDARFLFPEPERAREGRVGAVSDQHLGVCMWVCVCLGVTFIKVCLLWLSPFTCAFAFQTPVWKSAYLSLHSSPRFPAFSFVCFRQWIKLLQDSSSGFLIRCMGQASRLKQGRLECCALVRMLGPGGFLCFYLPGYGRVWLPLDSGGNPELPASSLHSTSVRVMCSCLTNHLKPNDSKSQSFILLKNLYFWAGLKRDSSSLLPHGTCWGGWKVWGFTSWGLKSCQAALLTYLADDAGFAWDLLWDCQLLNLHVTSVTAGCSHTACRQDSKANASRVKMEVHDIFMPPVAEVI